MWAAGWGRVLPWWGRPGWHWRLQGAW
jgi:hypothetical protein